MSKIAKAPVPKFPKATVRKIVKGHTNKSLRQNVDALVYLSYVAFIDELMQNATKKAQESGEKTVAARDIRKVTMTTLRKFHG